MLINDPSGQNNCIKNKSAPWHFRCVVGAQHLSLLDRQGKYPAAHDVRAALLGPSFTIQGHLKNELIPPTRRLNTWKTPFLTRGASSHAVRSWLRWDRQCLPRPRP